MRYLPRAVVLTLVLLTSTGCTYQWGGDTAPPPAWDVVTKAACLDFADALGAKQVACKMSAGWVNKTMLAMKSKCDRTRPDLNANAVEGDCIDRVDFTECAALGNLSTLCPEIKLWWD